MTEILSKEFSRKTFLKGGGALVVGFSLAGSGLAGKAAAGTPVTADGYLPPQNQVDSWLTVLPDNTVVFKTSQIEAGQGITTGFLMLVAEELDLAPSQVRHGPFDSYQVVDSGDTGGSGGMQSSGGPRLRAAAAYARQALMALAAKELGVAASSLTVKDGVISGGGRTTTYGQLVGGRLINATIGSATLNPGVAPSKPVAQYSLIGTNVPRVDIPDKITGRYTYVHNVKVPGMLHARWIRPRGQGPYGTGATILSIDESSIKKIPGARIIREGNLLGVVAEREYDAIQAAVQLKVEWKDTPILPTTGNLWKQMRTHDSAGKAPARHTMNVGNVDTAFKSAAKTVTQTYKYMYNGHAVIGPSAVVADVRPDSATVFSNTQKLQEMVTVIADVLKMEPRKVRVIFNEGASSFGEAQTRWDVAQAAAVFSKLAGKPVKLQLMRWDEHGWDLFGPAQMMDMRGAIDANGKITVYDYTVMAQPSSNHDSTMALLGEPHPTPGNTSPRTEAAGEAYSIPNKRLTGKTMPAFEGYIKVANLRNPRGLETAFASEQLIDELAYAAGMDPLAFRRLNITNDRYMTPLNAVAQAANWQPRVAASNLSNAVVATGRGFGFGRHGSAGHAASIVDIEVNKKTGKIVVKHIYTAIDAGLAVNPALIENQVSGAGVMGVSRALEESVRFNKSRVLGLDWVSYPILRFQDAPKVTPVVVQRKEFVPLGAGEPPHQPIPPAIANAFFDATGVRIREAPMTPARVRAVLAAAGK